MNNYNYNLMRNSNSNPPIYYSDQSGNRIVGGFLGPFLLGGITGGLVAPFFYGGGGYGYGRPNYYYNNYYYTPYPYYGPYYR